MLKWYKNVWSKYLEYAESLCEGFGYLILDKAPSHLTEASLAIMKNDKNLLSFILARLTRFIQPLDVSINKPFKDVLEKEYVNYYIDIKGENVKITREKMIDFVCKVWYDEYIISKEMIKKSFICTGIFYVKNDLAHDYEEIEAIQEDMELDN